MVINPPGPDTIDSIGITTLKWLQAIRANSGITDNQTVPDTRDPWGTVLRKILTVYFQNQ